VKLTVFWGVYPSKFGIGTKIYKGDLIEKIKQAIEKNWQIQLYK